MAGMMGRNRDHASDRTRMNADKLIALQRLPGSGYPTRIRLVLNWFTELNRPLPGGTPE